MIRGTTPTFEFTTDISLVDAVEIWVTFAQGNIKVNKTKGECIVTPETLTTELDQTETLMFRDKGYKALCQIRAELPGSPKNKAVASNIMEVDVSPILKEGVI